MKSVEQILNQKYMNANDLIVIIPELKKYKALQYIKEIQDEMRTKNYFVPVTKEKIALTKLVKKKFNL